MIGMMYLVLTALLALQVDDKLLDKFLFIDDSLQFSTLSTRGDNLKTFDGIRDAVEKRANSDEAQAVMDKARIVVQETDAVQKEINLLREEIVNITGGKDDAGKYKGAKEVDKVMNLVLGGGESKQGKGYRLKAVLNDYAQKISGLDPDLDISPLALDADEIDYYKSGDQKNKDFAQLNFYYTPMVAALAVLSQMQMEVAKVETKALDLLASKVGAEEYRVDRVQAIVSPESRVVTAGTPYRAKMLIAASSSSAEPEMTADVGDVEVGEFGIGNLEFIASANKFNEQGRARRVWKGSITLKTPSGDSTFYVEEEYEVAKPTLQFRSAAIQALYYNCGNNITVQVPELGSYYDPKFSAKGGEVITSNKRGVITIVPTSTKFSISVRNKGTFIGEESFRIKPVPKPTIALTTRGKALDIKKGGEFPRRLKVKAVAEPDFAEFLPRDARYRVTKWEATLVRNGIPRERKEFRKEEINLTEMARMAQKGDRLVVEVLETRRLNYLDKQEKVNMGVQVFSYDITK